MIFAGTPPTIVLHERLPLFWRMIDVVEFHEHAERRLRHLPAKLQRSRGGVDGQMPPDPVKKFSFVHLAYLHPFGLAFPLDGFIVLDR